MCFFLTLIVRAAHASAVMALPRSDVDSKVLAVHGHKNASIARLVGDRVSFVLTERGCSCDLFRAKRGTDASSTIDVARRKYTKLGWSAAKIERALASRRTDADRGGGFVGLRDDVRAMIARLADTTGDIGVLVHDYAGNVDEERVDASHGSVVTPDELRAGIVSIAEDTIVWVRASRGREPRG